MAVKKTEPFNLMESLQKTHDKWEENNVKRQYAISEVTPSHHESGTHGGSWTREEVRMVSPAYDTEAEALQWVTKFEPDDGNHFVMTRIDHQQTITRHVFVGREPITTDVG